MLHSVTTAGVLFVTLNDPAHRNVLNESMLSALGAELARTEQDETIRAFVLRGAGGVFCAGGDFTTFRTLMGTTTPGAGPDPIARNNRAFGALLTRLVDLPVPTIAVVVGAAAGGGTGLAAACDVVLAHSSATFSTPETGLGIPPAQIAPFVAARIGVARTRRLALTGTRFDGREAERIGLVDQACADTAALDAALAATLADISRCAPGANAAIKKLLLASRTTPRDELLDQSADAFAACLRGPEGQEGVTAFLGKRKPRWAT